ncbi:tripartite tricarboxylate transporter substrate binding protein [Caenimonas sp. SL110]|uniref:Bug family tripartite tricarboxylate transporter substrate binding protein n=1 Tax=Caenimonas sp. SL110 TaxID=1450524 RepID=UPI00065313DB|nr:tripartite tricarboxylate transporter substrate binding protein [Caenimonas sp. SL110]
MHFDQKNPTSLISRRSLLIGGTATAASVLVPSLSFAAETSAYPERPITFICPWPAGGTADQSMRAICQVAAGVLKQPIAVDNKAGAAGMIGAKAIASAKPDGYTIGQIPISVTRFSQLGTLQADPRKDFTYLARTSGQTFGIAVLPTSKFATLKDMVAFAKANPGKVTYAHAGVGGATHVGMEEFAIAAGIQLNAIAYKGGAQALQDTLGGQVDMLADSSSWAPHVEGGKLRLLATWGEQRTPRFKDTPTLKELGFKVVVDAPNGIGAPKGLDPVVEKKLRDAFRFAVNSSEFKAVADRIDAPLMYLDGPDYQKYVNTVYTRETQLIERLKLKEMLQKG